MYNCPVFKIIFHHKKKILTLLSLVFSLFVVNNYVYAADNYYNLEIQHIEGDNYYAVVDDQLVQDYKDNLESTGMFSTEREVWDLFVIGPNNFDDKNLFRNPGINNYVDLGDGRIGYEFTMHTDAYDGDDEKIRTVTLSNRNQLAFMSDSTILGSIDYNFETNTLVGAADDTSLLNLIPNDDEYDDEVTLGNPTEGSSQFFVSLQNVSKNVINLFIGLGVLVSVFMLPYIGLLFAKGGEQDIQKAKEMLTSWIWGMLLLLLGGAIFSIVGTDLLRLDG